MPEVRTFVLSSSGGGLPGRLATLTSRGACFYLSLASGSSRTHLTNQLWYHSHFSNAPNSSQSGAVIYLGCSQCVLLNGHRAKRLRRVLSLIFRRPWRSLHTRYSKHW